ncbi:hypothetical protein SACE_2312 [Saccharopolyspora erythraea NRRL 2338]|uniref:Transposase Helix-turn-helix domain-containing protein n=1 Tax=Saccharopolyspora erythraea (strain ATCC 11635 / DSM 40517 / JCM 4748 / NBRC 13426 / NCIMB 8594 / NRRL 2338) TaxID=405948 RepID=A4FC38_SACEN|nr:hypothetical protein N599_18920 [Saccharopolyspora erythraea D]QRK92022.1 transposase family protein [Saccharopolyspora erythraea]CAM01613.1 hypothetical protein SACE_2312 [Saccharopolyspora erythraea NRRL 2338]
MLLQVIGVDQPGWIPTFTGLSVRQFGKLVGIVRRRGAEQTGAGRRWGLSLDDRVLLVAVYYRTNLTLRQVALLFDISPLRPRAVHPRLWVRTAIRGFPRPSPFDIEREHVLPVRVCYRLGKWIRWLRRCHAALQCSAAASPATSGEQSERLIGNDATHETGEHR